MIRRSAAGVCILTLFFNITFLGAQKENIDVEEQAEVDLVEENIKDINNQVEAESLKTLAAEESLLVQDINDVDPDTVLLEQEEALPKKSFKGTAKDVVLAVTSIIGWLFFMWLTANQRE